MGQRYELVTSDSRGTEVLRAQLDVKSNEGCMHCGRTTAIWSYARRTPLDLMPEVLGTYCTSRCATNAICARMKHEPCAQVRA